MMIRIIIFKIEKVGNVFENVFKRKKWEKSKLKD